MLSRLMVLFFILFCCNTYSQEKKIILTKSEKDTIIKNIGIFFKENYIFPDKGEDLQSSLSLLNSQGLFDTIRNPLVFRRAMQDAIRNIIDDKHIIFIYRDPKDHQPVESNFISDISDLEAEFGERKTENFGIPELKVLENNIGYIKITKFTSPELFGPVMRSSSEFLKNVDGLILDFRSRGGGRSETVVHLLSYFLPYNTHIFDWENREGVVFERNWTLPRVDGYHFNDIPIAVLTSEETFSGSEAFCYIMKHHGKATLVGETTRGGAHSYKEMYPSEKYLILVPTQRILSAKTNKNWEGSGVTPTINTSAETALEVAQKKVLKLISKAN